MPVISASPRDMNIIPGYSGDYRTIDKLVNGVHLTTDDHNMWLIPFTKGKKHTIDINLQSRRQVSGLVFWNYNKNAEDTARGAKHIKLTVDGQSFSVVLRKACGDDHHDFGQFVPLPFSEPEMQSPSKCYATELFRLDYECPWLPQGFTLKLRLMSTWGDMHYIGMNGIEVYD